MTCFAIAMACLFTMLPLQVEAQQPARVTILYDAFGPASALQKDWGFAALIEYGGRRILFDTGNDGGIFAHNVEQLGVDLTRLDAAVISHRHGDHTTGLEVLIAANATVPIYAPQEGAFSEAQRRRSSLRETPRCLGTCATSMVRIPTTCAAALLGEEATSRS
jgi:metal-dependent hydrolase (beta-lactamase superfamily II)